MYHQMYHQYIFASWKQDLEDEVERNTVRIWCPSWKQTPIIRRWFLTFCIEDHRLNPTDVHLFWGVDIPFYVLSLSIYNMGHKNIYVYIFETIIYHMHWSSQLWLDIINMDCQMSISTGQIHTSKNICLQHSHPTLYISIYSNIPGPFFNTNKIIALLILRRSHSSEVPD